MSGALLGLHSGVAVVVSLRLCLQDGALGLVCGKKRSLEPERQVHEREHRRDLNERADDAHERRVRLEAERRHRHGERQLKVVARGRERERDALFVRGADLGAHIERRDEHDGKVDQQRHRRVQHFANVVRDARALGRKQHDDREQQRDEREHTDARRKLRKVVRRPFGSRKREPREQCQRERHTHVDADVLGDLADGYVHFGRFNAHVAREFAHKEARVRRVKREREHRVDADDRGAVLVVAARECIPHDNHRDAAGTADETEPCHVPDVVMEERGREEVHQRWPDDPVLNRRQEQQLPVGEHAPDEVPAHFAQRRVHHHDEPDGDEHVRATDSRVVDEVLHRQDLPEPQAEPRSQEDPER